MAARSGTPQAIDIEAIAGFSQFGLAHDDWGNRFPSWNTIPVRHVVFEQQILDRNPYLAETSCVASILDMADGGRIFSISPAQARFNRESVAFFNASCGPIIERGGSCRRPITAMRLCASRCRTWCIAACSNRTESRSSPGESRQGTRVPRLVGSVIPARQPGDRSGRALYIVDMYRELVEHPQFVPESARGKVDFRALARSRADLASPSQVRRGCRASANPV